MLGVNDIPASPILDVTPSQTPGAGMPAIVTLTPAPGRSIHLGEVRFSVANDTDYSLQIVWGSQVEEFSFSEPGSYAFPYWPPVVFPRDTVVTVQVTPTSPTAVCRVYVTAWQG